MNLKQIVLTAAIVLTPYAAFAQGTPAPTPTPAPVNGQVIHARKVTQQERIQQGARSGELTRGETHRLESQERGINREERGMRAEDNGKLTRGDKTLLTKQQNQESKRIYNKKHNGNVRK